MCAPTARRFSVDAHGGGQRVSDRGFRKQALSAGAVAFIDKQDLVTASLRQGIEDALR
jgi:hypothetical protein